MGHSERIEVDTRGFEREISTLFHEERSWYEVILTLWRKEIRTGERVINASVVGIQRSGLDLGFTLFEGSNSFEFIDSNPVVGISIPDIHEGLDLFIRASLHGYGNHEIEFEPGELEVLSTPPGPALLLRACPAGLVMKVEEIDQKDFEDKLGTTRVKRIRGPVLEFKKGEGGIRAYSRSSGQIVEALITATRYLACGKKELLETIERNLKSAEKIGGKETIRRVKDIRGRLYSSSSRFE